MGEWQQFLKFCQCLSAFTPVPAAQEESTPPKEKKKSSNKTSTVRLSCGGWHTDGPALSSLCRACTQPPMKLSFQLSSPTPPTVFQPLAFCGIEGFLFFSLRLIFLSFTWTMASGKRSSWHPAFCLVLYLQQPHKMENRKPHSPSSWVVGLFGVLVLG